MKSKQSGDLVWVYHSRLKKNILGTIWGSDMIFSSLSKKPNGDDVTWGFVIKQDSPYCDFRYVSKTPKCGYRTSNIRY
jgi:hypothetical protein